MMGSSSGGGGGAGGGARARFKQTLERRTSQLNHEVHPMQNSLILKEIFAYSSVSTLKMCRLVSKLWLDVSLDEWRRKAVLRVTLDPSSDDDVDEEEEEGVRPSSLYIRDLRECYEGSGPPTLYKFRTKPFQSYAIHKDMSSLGDHDQVDGFQWLFDHVPAQILYLEVRNLKFNSCTELKELVFDKLTELRTLKLKQIEIRSRGDDPQGGEGAEGAVEGEEEEMEERMREARPHPQLRKLEVAGNYTTGDPDPFEGLPWDRFFSKMPKLEDLKLKLFYYLVHAERFSSHRSFAQNLMDNLFKAKEENRTSLPLKSLDLMDMDVGTWGTSRMRYLRNMARRCRSCQLPLERLSLNCCRSSRFLREMLDMHSRTLNYLRVYYGPRLRGVLSGGCSPLFRGRRLTMAKLREIRVVDGLAWGFRLLKSLTTPNLEKLVIEPSSSASRAEVEPVVVQDPQGQGGADAAGRSRTRGQRPIQKRLYPDPSELSLPGRMDHKKLSHEVEHRFFARDLLPPLVKEGLVLERLHTFEFISDWYHFTSEELSSLGKAMPQLRQVTLPLTSSTFQKLCRVWPGVKELTILETIPIIESEDEVNNEAITGISFGVKEGTKCMDCYKTKCRPPNITDLGELERLTIHCQRGRWRGQLKLTDHSVFHGFLHAPKLNYLNVAFKKLSTEARAALEEKVPNLEIQEEEEEEEDDDLEPEPAPCRPGPSRGKGAMVAPPTPANYSDSDSD